MLQLNKTLLPSAAWLLAISSWPLLAQGPSGSAAASPSRATQLPLSGQSNGGSAQVQQNANTDGISTVSSSIQVSGALAGSVPSATTGSGPIQLTLNEAVTRALKTNLSPISANNSVSYARASRLQSLSELLPNISVNASETVTQVNLAAYGLSISLPASSGLSFPTVVGPYQYSQLQGALSQSILNLVQSRNYRGSKESERASTLSARDTRELVVLAVAGTYLQVVASTARVISQQAQVDNAEAIYKQAQVRKSAGVNSKIDVMRSLVELQTQQQRLSAFQADVSKQKLSLARLIGLPLDRELLLSDTFTPGDDSVPDEPTAIQTALQKRWDLRASESQVKVAELAVSAAHAERYPSVNLSGDYGVIGPTPASQHGVFAVTGSVNLPLYSGGRMKADLLEAETALRQRRSELADQQGRVESEVRTALIELRTAAGQVQLATSNRGYASETLAEARDRFEAGVATTVEVVQAQEQVASAENDYITSLFSYQLSRLSLARATGEAEANLENLSRKKQP